HWGDICTVLTFGGYLYRPDIWAFRHLDWLSFVNSITFL
ncbi:unnamed protein product, partial [Staurois parvus]